MTDVDNSFLLFKYGNLFRACVKEMLLWIKSRNVQVKPKNIFKEQIKNYKTNCSYNFCKGDRWIVVKPG